MERISIHGFSVRKPFVNLSLNFLNIKLEIRLRFSYYFSKLLFLTFFVSLLRFNTNNKHHFVI